MAYLISEDMDDDIIHASVHGVFDRAGLDFYRRRLADVGRSASAISSRFIERATEYLGRFDLDNIRDGLNSMRDRFGKRHDVDRIRYLDNLSEIQQAKNVMRRWAMANPRARKLWRDGVISGYEGNFIGSEDRSIGTDLLDYRNVMQGAYVGTEDEDRFVTYVDLVEGVEEGYDTLTFNERAVIRRTWELMDELLDEGLQDPTSTYKALI